MAKKNFKIQDYHNSEDDPKESADFLQRANLVKQSDSHNHKVIWPFLILSIFWLPLVLDLCMAISLIQFLMMCQSG